MYWGGALGQSMGKRGPTNDFSKITQKYYNRSPKDRIALLSVLKTCRLPSRQQPLQHAQSTSASLSPSGPPRALPCLFKDAVLFFFIKNCLFDPGFAQKNPGNRPSKLKNSPGPRNEVPDQFGEGQNLTCFLKC